MKKQVWFVFLLWVISFVSATEYLVVTQNLGNEKNAFAVLEQNEDYFFVLADARQLQLLQKYNHLYTLLDTNPRAKFYLFVWTDRSHELLVAQFGTVLGYYNDYFLLRTTEARITDLNNERLEISRLRFTPIDYNTKSQFDSRQYQDTVNSFIEEMVKNISEDSLRYYIRTLQDFKSRVSSSTEMKNTVCPWVQNLFRSYNCDSIFNQVFGSQYGPNVIGIKKGRKDSSLTKYCVLGAHMDGVSNSTGRATAANDNGTGTAIVLEVARVLKRYTFNNTIQFHAWNSEEQGEVGSNAFAKYAKANNHTIIGGAINFDMVGSNVGANKVDMTYNSTISGCQDFATNVFKKVTDAYTKLSYNLLSKTSIPTDHGSFWSAGYSAIGGVENNYGSDPTYHASFDTLDCPSGGLKNTKIVTETAKAALACIATLAVPFINSSINHYNTSEGIWSLTSYKKNNLVFFSVRLLSSKVPIQIALYNVSGQLVQTLLPQTRQDGNYTFVWNGQTAAGGSAAHGVYIAVFKNNQNTAFHELIVH